METESYASEVIKQIIPSKNEAILFLVETPTRPFYDIEVVPIKMWALTEQRHKIKGYESDIEITTEIKPITFEDKYIDTVDPMDEEYIICYVDLNKDTGDLSIKYQKEIKETFDKIIRKRARIAAKNFNEHQKQMEAK